MATEDASLNSVQKLFKWSTGDPQMPQLCSVCTTAAWLQALCPGHVWHLVFLDQECQPGSYLTPPCSETQVSSLRTEISSICHAVHWVDRGTSYVLDTCPVSRPCFRWCCRCNLMSTWPKIEPHYGNVCGGPWAGASCPGLVVDVKTCHYGDRHPEMTSASHPTMLLSKQERERPQSQNPVKGHPDFNQVSESLASADAQARCKTF